jgi:hypothetical protein
MTDKEKTALAMLSSGSSFKEASDLTGIDINHLMALWRETHQKAA